MLQQINKFKFISIFAMCITSLNVLGQAIVNIEDLRREGEVGFFTNISANLNASRGNRDRDFTLCNSDLIIIQWMQSLF